MMVLGTLFSGVGVAKVLLLSITFGIPPPFRVNLNLMALSGEQENRIPT